MRNDIQGERFQYKISLGQNFIYDEALLSKLVELSGIGPEDSVLEIGAGRGDLSLALAKRCQKLVTLEIDDRLIPVLEERLAPYPGVSILHQDVMNCDLDALTRDFPPFHVVANLPYYITTPILNLLLRLKTSIRSASLMVQEEAAERVFAGPKDKGYGPLALLAAYRARGERLLKVPSSCFTPPPKVDSCFISLRFHDKPPVAVKDEAALFRLFHHAFAHRRKTLQNNLMGAYGLSREKSAEILRSLNYPLTLRAEELSLEGFAALSDALTSLR